MALGGANVSSRMAGSTGDLLLKIVISSNIVYKYIFMLSRRFMLYKAFFQECEMLYIYIIVYVYIYLWVILKYISYDDNIMKTNAEKYIRTAPR